MSYRDAAVVLWGEAGAYAHDAYQRHLHLYPELPAEVPIVIGITAYGRCLGLTRTRWEHGPRITLSSSIFSRGRQVVDDTMVHEMLHAWLAHTGQPIGHDTEAWYAAVRRLSPAVLGHPLRRPAGRRPPLAPGPEPRLRPTRRTQDPRSQGPGRRGRHPRRRRPLARPAPDTPPGLPISCPTY